jgi:hypothetical protein
MCGSLFCCSRTLQFMPGKMKLLQCLQTCLLYSIGNRTLADMAIFLAVSMYCVARFGFSWTVTFASLKSVSIRSLAIRLVSASTVSSYPTVCFIVDVFNETRATNIVTFFINMRH